MARGHDGAFGGKPINSYPVWLGLCALFFVGLADLRRPLSLAQPRPARAAVPLRLALVLQRRAGSSRASRLSTRCCSTCSPGCMDRLATGRRAGSRPVWPVWLLVGATVFVMGFRIGLDVARLERDRRRLLGRDRRTADRERRAAVRPLPARRSVRRARRPIATGGRRSGSRRTAAVSRPTPTGTRTARLSTRPTSRVLVLRLEGEWDDLRAARFTSILFDFLCLLGLALVGWRYGGGRLAATLAFAWAAYPFTQYVSSSNTNDAIQPALLDLGLLARVFACGAWLFAALAAWTKFASLLVCRSG